MASTDVIESSFERKFKELCQPQTLDLQMLFWLWVTVLLNHLSICLSENDKPMKGLRQEDLMNQDLITELRKEYGMTYDEFYMVLTDTDMRVQVWVPYMFLYSWQKVFFKLNFHRLLKA